MPKHGFHPDADALRPLPGDRVRESAASRQRREDRLDVLTAISVALAIVSWGYVAIVLTIHPH